MPFTWPPCYQPYNPTVNKMTFEKEKNSRVCALVTRSASPAASRGRGATRPKPRVRDRLPFASFIRPDEIHLLGIGPDLTDSSVDGSLLPALGDTGYGIVVGE
jgi:hypothetical protein